MNDFSIYFLKLRNGLSLSNSLLKLLLVNTVWIVDNRIAS